MKAYILYRIIKPKSLLLSKNQKGFSIIELLIIIVFLSIIAMGLIPLFTKAIATNHASRNKLYAYQAAHSEIEKLRTQDFDSLNGYNFTITGVPSGSGTVEVDENVDGALRTDIVKVTAKVNWQFAGKAEEIKLATYISSKGMR